MIRSPLTEDCISAGGVTNTMVFSRRFIIRINIAKSVAWMSVVNIY